jgi:hypothetical protein
MTGPYFETWSHENLAKFAKDAYVRLQEQEQLRAAVAAEREACAKLCDSSIHDTYIEGYTGAKHSARRECAAAIRARGEMK